MGVAANQQQYIQPRRHDVFATRLRNGYDYRINQHDNTLLRVYINMLYHNLQAEVLNTFLQSPFQQTGNLDCANSDRAIVDGDNDNDNDDVRINNKILKNYFYIVSHCIYRIRERRLVYPGACPQVGRRRFEIIAGPDPGNS